MISARAIAEGNIKNVVGRGSRKSGSRKGFRENIYESFLFRIGLVTSFLINLLKLIIEILTLQQEAEVV
jgi:hypothetical protein